MSPVKETDRVSAICRDPVGVEEGLVGEKEAYAASVEQQWEDAAPRTATQLSGLFNNLDMDMTVSGLSTVDGVIDSNKISLDLSETSTVNLAELFPDLTDIFIPVNSDDALSPTATDKDEAVEAESDVFALSPVEAKVVTTNGEVSRGRQLPSTSSFSSGGSEMSDYEEGLSPAEVDGALEHFFNEFTDLKEFLVPAEETGPTATCTVDAATVRSLIDDPTTTETIQLLTPLVNENGSLPLSTASSTSKRIKCEEDDDDEEEACHVAKKSRSSPSGSSGTSTKNPEEMYRQRRIKNNLACKRARQNRKKREGDLVTTARVLEEENALLKVKIEELTKIAAEARSALVSVLAK